MAQFEPLAGKFQEQCVQLAYIAAEKRGGMFKPEQYLEKNRISFLFLLDEDRCVTKLYGLYHRIGLDAFNIAHPATLVVDTGRMIRYRTVAVTRRIVHPWSTYWKQWNG